MKSQRIIRDITNDCNTKYVQAEGAYVIFYKNVPLFLTAYNNDPRYVKGQKLEVLVDTDDGAETFYIQATTPVIGMPGEFDYNLYGEWYDKNKVEEWLESPTSI